MKFNVGDINSYTGKDLILMVGCPGSRWSNVHRWICVHPSINKTDWSAEKGWSALSYNINNEVSNVGIHYGSYWGPGNYYGEKFDRLNELSKEEILSEFMEAYETWDDIKIIKSHWFAYHLDYIHALFPDATVIACYSGDVDSMYWWHKCTGWGLGYAGYAWYVDDVRMYEKIKEENSNILKYSIDRGAEFKEMRMLDVWRELGLYEIPEISPDPVTNPPTKCKVAFIRGYEPQSLAFCLTSRVERQDNTDAEITAALNKFLENKKGV
jgi:hypothetical protein